MLLLSNRPGGESNRISACLCFCIHVWSDAWNVTLWTLGSAHVHLSEVCSHVCAWLWLKVWMFAHDVCLYLEIWNSAAVSRGDTLDISETSWNPRLAHWMSATLTIYVSASPVADSMKSRGDKLNLSQLCPYLPVCLADLCVCQCSSLSEKVRLLVYLCQQWPIYHVHTSLIKMVSRLLLYVYTGH